MATTPTAPTPTPAPKTNRIGLQVLDYRGGKTTLCAGCGHNAISERILDAMYEMGVQPERLVEDERNRLFIEDSGLLHEPRPQLQFRTRPHAIGRDRSDAGQQEPACAGHQRRWRYRLHRRRTVHSPDAPQSAYHLHHRR